MGTFSTNQVRQLYVASSYVTDAPSAEGAISVSKVADSTGEKNLYFNYCGAGKSKMRSDLIKVNNITNIKITPANKMNKQLRMVKVVIDSNGGIPVIGEDYMVRIIIRKFIGQSDEDQYFKYGIAHATTANASDIYKTLAKSLAINFSREVTQLFNFYLSTAASPTAKSQLIKVDASTSLSSLSGTYVALYIEEAEQTDWVRGVRSKTNVDFTVQTTQIEVNGGDVLWGTVTDVTTAALITSYNNGCDIADLEYFCMGERGDIYRNISWPNVIPTKYFVDETKAYNVLDIHYFYEGDGMNSQKSEKTITIVATDLEILNSIKEKIDA